jgi:hypothetical protein
LENGTFWPLSVHLKKLSEIEEMRQHTTGSSLHNQFKDYRQHTTGSSLHNQFKDYRQPGITLGFANVTICDF